MTLPIVLDREGLVALASSRPPPGLRAFLDEAWRRDRDVLLPTLVCAEVCRSAARTRSVEAALQRHDPAAGQHPAVRLVDTTFALARSVGALLARAGTGTADIVDAHVVAVAAAHGGAVIVTSDAGDILRLARAVPAARILTRSPR